VEDNIKRDFREIGRNNASLLELVQDQVIALILVALNFGILVSWLDNNKQTN
jgi:hypothetical protein